ncbi:MAG: NAD(P)/FAD-dependent oxidoreductase [Chloroflexota bacterium]|nr:MAG: NAD(P)/FAD-dependent oxidoreductase [Chloroflexota bacterium]
MTTEVDVAIVGARVAGSVTATLLGEAGHRVILVDAARFPSDTISTHFFRGGGLGSVLDRLSLLDDVLALGSPRLTSEYNFRGTDASPMVRGPQNPGTVGYCLSTRRLPLDHLLAERARRTAGVELWEGTPARAVRHADGRVTGLAVDRDGATHEVKARIVIGADGRGSSVARWVGASVERREPATRAMYYRYFTGYRGPGGSWDGPEFSAIGDELVYAFPSDDDLACLAVSINLDAFAQFRANPESMFGSRIAAHPGLAPRFAAANPETRILASGPKDALVRQPSGPGWALVGDASICQDPWTGLGMDNASVHATFLAEAVDAWLSGRSGEREALDSYRRRRDEHALPGFDATADLGRDLSRL